jgi:endo-1,4-beta-xylanase
VEHYYEVPIYDNSDIGTFDKTMSIYTPYGYDPDKQYNVLFLYHGGGGDCHDWTDAEFDSGGTIICMRNIYDNMIDKKMCEPFIVVSLETGHLAPGSSWNRIDESAWQVSEELRNIVLPYIINNYSTYAYSANPVDIEEARAHFGIGGDSNGSLYAYWVGMDKNFNYFGNYLIISGNAHQDAVKSVNQGEWAELPFNCFFCGAGDEDDQKHRVEIGYQEMLESTDRLVEGQNAFMLGTALGHDWSTFSTIFSNAIQVMFEEFDVLNDNF